MNTYENTYEHLWLLSLAVVNLCCGVVHLRLEPSTLKHKYTAISTTTTGTPQPPTVPLHAHRRMCGAKSVAMGLFPTHHCTPQLARQSFATSCVGYSKVCFAQVTGYPSQSQASLGFAKPGKPWRLSHAATPACTS